MKYFCLLPDAEDLAFRQECATPGVVSHPANPHPCGILVVVGDRSHAYRSAREWKRRSTIQNRETGVKCFYYNPLDDSYCLLKHAVIDMTEFYNARSPCVISLLEYATQIPGLSFGSVVIGKSCATAEVLAFMAGIQATFWCEVGETWTVIDSDASQLGRKIDTVDFDVDELKTGKILWSGSLRQDHTVCAFKVEDAVCAPSYFVTNALAGHTVEDVSLISDLLKVARRHKDGLDG